MKNRNGLPPGRQDRILKATITLLLEAGLHATTTRAVTQRAEVGTGLLNHYFRWPELRAQAWGRIFADVAQDQFSPNAEPCAALEHYLATAFTPDASRFWKLWTEAADLAATDAAMAQVLVATRRCFDEGLKDLLSRGCAAGLWKVPDPSGSALRISALYDGLAARLLSRASDLDPQLAEAHLRSALRLECGAGGMMMV